MTNETGVGREGKEAARPTRRFPRPRISEPERRRMRDEIREVNFPMGLRGYDRGAVDDYVKQVNRVIAELEISSSPEAAIRHALEEVSEETSGILQRAYESADDITARSRAKADDRLQGAIEEADEVRAAAAADAEEVRTAAARAAEEVRETADRETQELRARAALEVQELRETAAREVQELRAGVEQAVTALRAEAEERVRELDSNAEAIRRERLRLIEDMRTIGQQLLEIADAQAMRFTNADESSGADVKPDAEPEVEGPERTDELEVERPEPTGHA